VFQEERGHTKTQREDSHVKMGTEIGVVLLQAKRWKRQRRIDLFWSL
jgi:hypothetical protein